MTATIKVQCKDEHGETGDFISQDGKRVSPLFTSLADLFPWMKQNGWQNQFTHDRPWGVVRTPPSQS
jgi:hypothetical protein